MSKTIEEIKGQVVYEYEWINWIWFLSDCPDHEKDVVIDEVAERYAKSQTQELQEQNSELIEMLSLVCMDMEERGRAYGDAYTMSKELLTKHNHLNKKL